MKKTRRIIALTVSAVATLSLLIWSVARYIKFLRVWDFSPLDLVFIGTALVAFVLVVGINLERDGKPPETIGWKFVTMWIVLVAIGVLLLVMTVGFIPRYSELGNSLWPLIFAGSSFAWFIHEKRRKPKQAA